MSDPVNELEVLEAHREELQREQSGLDRHGTELQRDKAELDARLAAVTDIDEAQKLESQLQEIALWHRVIDNRGPAVQRELVELGQQINAARRAVNRHRVAELLLAADVVIAEMLTSIDRLGELRQHAVVSGAPQTLLAPPPEADPPTVERLSQSDVVVFRLVDRLAAYLRGPWAHELVPRAREDLS